MRSSYAATGDVLAASVQIQQDAVLPQQPQQQQQQNAVSIDSDQSNSSTSAVGATGSSASDEITTIFVVGFPDDMLEREFQNMFIFSTGFEAASLKISQQSAEECDFSASSGNRKQTIGFAKFGSRKEAMKARDVLNGKKVDSEKGCLLKAEMAKKNLHTKRAPSATGTNGTTTSTASNGSSLFNDGIVKHRLSDHSHSKSLDRSHDAVGGLATLDAQATVESLLMRRNKIGDVFGTSNGTSASRISRLTSLKAMLDHPETITNNEIHGDSILASLYSSPKSAPLMQDPHQDHMKKFFVNGRPNPAFDSEGGYSLPSTSPVYANHPQTLPPPQAQSIGATPNGVNASGLFGASSLLRPAAATVVDQNPPCNTLYVGNLSTNADEEELRRLFARCLGFKRMSFKVKSNGPMCFVEFEDIPHAAQVLQNLQGSPLSNSTKGGIRLSYSKNPLGVRQAAQSSQQPQEQQQQQQQQQSQKARPPIHHKSIPSPLTLTTSNIYIPAGPASAPPTLNATSTSTSPSASGFSTGPFASLGRDVIGSAMGRSALREHWSSIPNTTTATAITATAMTMSPSSSSASSASSSSASSAPSSVPSSAGIGSNFPTSASSSHHARI